MASVTGLPVGLRLRLQEAGRRLRRLQLIRGIGLLVAVQALGVGIALLLDAWLDLAGGVRLALLIAWLAVGASAAILALVRPLCRRLDTEELAAAIEARYPDLGERLLTSVELIDADDLDHGSRAFVSLLVQETDARTRRLDVLQAFPVRKTARWAGAGALAMVLLGMPALIQPRPYAERGKRFFMAWHTPAPVVPYDLVVTPGDGAAARGRPLAFGVQIVPRMESAVLPKACALVLNEAGGRVERFPMTMERSDAFALTLPQLAGDIHYHVEAADVIGEEHRIAAIEPVELAPDNPEIAVVPPAYAKNAVERQEVRGLVDLIALQHSNVTFAFHFTRPAIAARLELLPASDKGAKVQRRIVLDLNADRTSGQCALRARESFSYRVILEAEHGIVTELGPRALTVKPDQPPAFVKVGGQRESLVVQPYETVPLHMEISDDVAVQRADLEYQINDAPPVTEAIALTGTGTRQASGHLDFQLAGKVKEGDIVHYRLKAVDNRRVPEVNLGPNVTYWPPELRGKPQWRTLRIARGATPLKEQEIVARHQDIAQKIEAIQRKVRQEQTAVDRMRQEARRSRDDRTSLTQNVAEARRQNKAATNDLTDLAHEVGLQAEMQPISDSLNDLADQEMKRADTDLGQAMKNEEARARDTSMGQAEQELRMADRKLEALKRLNEQLAKANLDRAKFDSVTERQEQLARRTAEQAKTDPVRDPNAKNRTQELNREQQDIARNLQQQTEQNDSLRKAVEAAQAEEAQRMAEKARTLAQKERDLAKAARDAEQRMRQEHLNDLARRQQELADTAQRLAKETQQPAATAKTTPLRPDDARRAAEDLKQGKPSEAMRNQDQAARELDRLARELERAADEARAPRESARQLARAQEGLRQRLEKETRQPASREPLAERVQKLQTEQKALHEAVDRLPRPEKDAAAQRDRNAASANATKAAAALAKGDAREADARMSDTRQALERLAEKLSSQKQPQAPSENATSPRGLPTRQQSEKARRLAQEQRDLKAAVEKASQQSTPIAAATAQRQQQQDLQHQTDDLVKDFDKTARQMHRPASAQQAMHQATRSSEQARQAMQRSQEQNHQGKSSEAQQSQQQAAEALEQAARLAEQASRQTNAGSPSIAKTGQQLQRAQSQMSQAQRQLAQGQPRAAQSAMQQAADALQQARQQMPAPQPSRTAANANANKMGAPPDGRPDVSMFGKDYKQYAGKTWGELPGELRTKIIQDMQARYGEDYARIIKLYFEQIADDKAATQPAAGPSR